MATFAIADIHGRIQELEALLEYLPISSSDSLVFLGDYIDRGPDSRAVIDKLIELQSNHPRNYFLKGNHEEMAISSRGKDHLVKQWMKFGGDRTLQSYQDGIPDSHWEFLENLSVFVETEQAIYIHASLDAGLPMEDQEHDILIWRRLTMPVRHYSGKKIICGHSTRQSGYPILLGDARCIDCADWLTAIDVETDQIYQVNNVNNKRSLSLGDEDGSNQEAGSRDTCY